MGALSPNPDTALISTISAATVPVSSSSEYSSATSSKYALGAEDPAPPPRELSRSQLHTLDIRCGSYQTELTYIPRSSKNT